MKRFKRNVYRVSEVLGIILLSTFLFFALRPEGEFKPPARNLKGDRDGSIALKVLTWNILRGDNQYLKGQSWEKRQEAYRAILTENNFDILCFQEALSDQIDFFRVLLSDYDYVGVGRDDGKSQGEYNPIFFNKDRYLLVETDTFWLSPTPDIPSKGWGEVYPRICTWVELMEKNSGRRFRVYNTHMQISPYAQYHGANLLLKRIDEVDIPAILAGDMNSFVKWPALCVFEKNGLVEAETSGALTYHIAGKGIFCLDHIFFTEEWRVLTGSIIKEKRANLYPSDHFGLWAMLELRPMMTLNKKTNDLLRSPSRDSGGCVKQGDVGAKGTLQR